MGQVTRQTNLGYSDSGLLQSARRKPEKNSDSMAGARSKPEGKLYWKWIRLGEQPHLTTARWVLTTKVTCAQKSLRLCKQSFNCMPFSCDLRFLTLVMFALNLFYFLKARF